MNTIDADLRDANGVVGADASMSRRHVMRLLAGFGATVMALGVAGRVDMVAASGATQFRTTARVNFRSGPGTTYAVIRVIPIGGIVAHTGRSTNGFHEVGYGGTYGWVHSSYLVPTGTGSDPVIVGEARTTANVNLRSGPSTGHQMLHIVAAGSVVQVSSTVQNGFRYVIHNGLAGWIADRYLTSGDDQGGNVMTTTAPLNLRAEPSTSARVLTVMPAGARVQVLHTGVGRFVNVNYHGMQGWAHLDYLN